MKARSGKQAIYYAVDQGATVISMSFSMSSPSPELQQALSYAASKRVVCVASAGNGGAERKTYPAAFSRVIGVGSVNARDLRSPLSNHGDSAKTSAPGEAVITTYPGNNYAGVWGTSFATALVCGAAALMQHVRPGASYRREERPGEGAKDRPGHGGGQVIVGALDFALPER